MKITLLIPFLMVFSSLTASASQNAFCPTNGSIAGRVHHPALKGKKSGTFKYAGNNPASFTYSYSVFNENDPIQFTNAYIIPALGGKFTLVCEYGAVEARLALHDQYENTTKCEITSGFTKKVPPGRASGLYEMFYGSTPEDMQVTCTSK